MANRIYVFISLTINTFQIQNKRKKKDHYDRIYWMKRKHVFWTTAPAEWKWCEIPFYDDRTIVKEPKKKN